MKMPRSNRKTDPKFVRAFERGMLRSAFVSMFWSVIEERKKAGNFTLQGLAKCLGTNKAEVSRWFNGDPNWTINTIASLAHALNVSIKIEAVDRDTNAVFTPAGFQQHKVSTSTQSRFQRLSGANIAPPVAASTSSIDRPMTIVWPGGPVEAAVAIPRADAA